MSHQQRRALLFAALVSTQTKSFEPELVLVRRWLDSWSGLGAIVVGMREHGYDLLERLG